MSLEISTAQTPAERKRAWRARQRENGLKEPSSTKRNIAHRARCREAGIPVRKPEPWKFDVGHFIAVDGEGYDTGNQIPMGEYSEPLDLHQYYYYKHVYSLLSCYDNKTKQHRELYKDGRHLTAFECLDFLLDVAKKAPKSAIMVCYSSVYDILQWIKTLPDADLTAIASADARHAAMLRHGNKSYEIYYRPRKQLRVHRFDDGIYSVERQMKDGSIERVRRKPDASFVLWDVIGFFQCSFTNTMKDWLPPEWRASNGGSHEDIARMKGQRSDFTKHDHEEVAAYNRAENEALADIMVRLRDALAHEDVGLKLTRWDGAGAVAAAIYRKHDTKRHMCDTMAEHPKVYRAALHAYSGGHIETYRIGCALDTPVYHYDIRSAYPDGIRRLPSFAAGKWLHWKSRGDGKVKPPPEGFTLVRVKWSHHVQTPNFIYPLFYRLDDGGILYPPDGEGWYWYPEFEVAHSLYRTRMFKGHSSFKICEWYHWKPASDVQPFEWVEDLYDRRAELKRRAKADPAAGAAQIVLKLGLNSLYGKMVQQVGYQWEGETLRKPPYFQIEWAGYVTAWCRAKAMQAALQQPDNVLSINTDGVFSLKPLDVDIGTGLGQWEMQEHNGIVIVMPGYYQYLDGVKNWTRYSRGFGKGGGAMDDVDLYCNSWLHKEEHIIIPDRRLISLKLALASKKLRPALGCWADMPRRLCMTGDNSKRVPYGKREKPWEGLCYTYPRNLPLDHYHLPRGLMVPKLSHPTREKWAVDPDAPKQVITEDDDEHETATDYED